MLEILLDQDSAIVDALCYCLTITKIINTYVSLILRIFTSSFYRENISSGLVICNVLNINLLFIKFLSAISYDHLVLVDYVISDETCFVAFLTHYLEYISDNWYAFTSSHHRLQGTIKAATQHADTNNCVDEIGTPFSLSRKRKRSQQTHNMVSEYVRLECEHQDQTAKSLVSYDLSDSSEDEMGNQSILHITMSCFIRLRLALERMLAKQIILNPQAPAKLASMIERVETLYETNS